MIVDPLGLLEVVTGDLVHPLVEGRGPADLDLDAVRHAGLGRLGHLGRGLELGVLVAGEAGHQVGGATVGRDVRRAAGGDERGNAADARDGLDPVGDLRDDRPGRPGQSTVLEAVVDGHQGGRRELAGEALLQVALHGQGLGAGHLEPARAKPVCQLPEAKLAMTASSTTQAPMTNQRRRTVNAPSRPSGCS